MKKNYFKNLLQVALLLAAPFVVSSCDDVIGQEDNPVASYVQWKTDADSTVVEMKVGGTYTRVATAVSSAIIAYESDNTEVATVDPVSGEVTAKKIGEANISAVVSGMSTNGRNVFEATKLTYKVNVIDKKIFVKALVEKTDSIVDFTANWGMKIDFSKKFKFFPALGTTGLSVSYRIIPSLASTEKPTDYPHYDSSIASIDANGKLTINNATGWCWVEAKINNSGATVPDTYDDNTAALKKDTIKVRVKEAIAYYNSANERTILTADKYKKVSEYAYPTSGTFNGTYAAGTYFVDMPLNAGTIKISGDVTFIFRDTHSENISNLVDVTDNATLNLFAQTQNAVWNDTKKAYTFAPGSFLLSVDRNNDGDAITNFKAINVCGGTLNGKTQTENCGGFAAIKDLNVYGGGSITAQNYGTNGYGISLLDGGKLTVAGGNVTATGKGSSTTFGYAVIGDVEISKGTFIASNGAYRAVKGNLSKSGDITIKYSDNSSTWVALTTATSNAPYIKAQKWPAE